ncbi:MAG: amidohydrolase, partial [Acidobacteria bacterium]|nr:amidohydrolase [Acidobacteriota bacterium]
ENRHPTRWELDKASPDHPIYISAMYGHIGVANSKAFELAHVTKDTPNPTGGVIRKDPKTGEPNGVLEESAQTLVRRIIPPFSDEQMMKAIKWASDHYASRGVTTSASPGSDRQRLMDLRNALSRGLLGIRVVTMTSKSLDQPSPSELGGFLPGFGNEWLRLSGIKMVQDGSIQGYTGYLTKPYHVPFKPYEEKPADPTYRGYPRQSRQQLTAMVKEIHRAGYQIGIHGNGDAAIDDIIAAYREAQKDFPRPDARHHVEHAQMSRDDQLDAMKELGITPSFYVGHVYYWGDRHRDIFIGPERGSRISPLKSAVDRGIRFTIHDDTPVTPVNPLQLLWVAATRLTVSGKVLGPEQRITPLQALRALTSDAAWQVFDEKIKGSIEPGKLADFVVLAENPLTIDPVKIRDIAILETVIGGKTAYARPAGTALR